MFKGVQSRELGRAVVEDTEFHSIWAGWVSDHQVLNAPSHFVDHRLEAQKLDVGCPISSALLPVSWD